MSSSIEVEKRTISNTVTSNTQSHLIPKQLNETIPLLIQQRTQALE